jgi:hypothetical protein
MKKKLPTPEDDSWDPYILGRPMGWQGAAIFCAIMLGGLAWLVYEVFVKRILW